MPTAQDDHWMVHLVEFVATYCRGGRHDRSKDRRLNQLQAAAGICMPWVRFKSLIAPEESSWKYLEGWIDKQGDDREDEDFSLTYGRGPRMFLEGRSSNHSQVVASFKAYLDEFEFDWGFKSLARRRQRGEA